MKGCGVLYFFALRLVAPLGGKLGLTGIVTDVPKVLWCCSQSLNLRLSFAVDLTVAAPAFGLRAPAVASRVAIPRPWENV